MTEGESRDNRPGYDSGGLVTLTHTPLYPVHALAGATFTDFAGFDMPVRYTSDLVEHHAVRRSAGLFDLSHMAEIEVSGPDAAAFLDYALSNTLSALELGQAKYSLILTEAGGIVDDLIVYRLELDRYLIVANAANRHQAVDALTNRTAGFEVVVVDTSDEWALIAVQGPKALAIVSATDSIHFEGSLSELRYYRILSGVLADTPGFIARTGYTGEDGFELLVSADVAPALWDAVVQSGVNHDLVLCGLACRDTLRLEAGMPLYGHELSLTTTPESAGLGRVVDHTKANFVGKEELATPATPTRVLVGLVAEGRRAPRADYAVIDPHSGDVIGQVTSGALSPTLGYPIAMAYVDLAFRAPGTEIAVDVRGQNLPVTVTALPFYSRKKESS
jgi:aminomethyltransferase